jgi:hypothetical protein
MRHLLLASAAVACLAIGVPAAQAQAQDGRRDGAATQAAPPAADQERDRAAPRGQRTPNQASPGQGAPNQGAQRAPADNQMKAQDESRPSGASGTRAQDRAQDNGAGRAERSKASNQAPKASDQATTNDQRRDSRDRRGDSRDRAQRDDVRDRRDRADRERDRTGRDMRGEDRRDRADQRDDRRDRADQRDDRRDRVDQRDDRRDRADRPQDSRRGSISLSNDQRVRISARFSDRIDRLNVQPLSRSRLSVSIGVVVPSAIRLYDVPVDIVEIYPGFRGHKFVVVEDEIVIIEPRSRRIVTTLPMSDARASAREPRATTGVAPRGERIGLTPRQRTVIRDTVLVEPSCRYEQRLEFFLVIPLPTTVRVCEFPERVVTEVPEIRRYRYLTRGDDVLVIDPDEHRVVEVID